MSKSSVMPSDLLRGSVTAKRQLLCLFVPALGQARGQRGEGGDDEPKIKQAGIAPRLLVHRFNQSYFSASVTTVV